MTRITVKEYANLKNLGVTTVYRHIKAGKLKAAAGKGKAAAGKGKAKPAGNLRQQAMAKAAARAAARRAAR